MAIIRTVGNAIKQAMMTEGGISSSLIFIPLDTGVKPAIRLEIEVVYNGQFSEAFEPVLPVQQGRRGKEFLVTLRVVYPLNTSNLGLVEKCELIKDYTDPAVFSGIRVLSTIFTGQSVSIIESDQEGTESFAVETNYTFHIN